MNGPVKTAVAAALFGVSAAAGASTFDFSYLFADGQQITGDFTGTTTDGGQSVTGIGNVQVSLNGCVASATSGQNASGKMRDFELLRAGRRRSEVYEQGRA